MVRDVAQTTSKRGAWEMKKILVAVDFSPASVAAAQHGLELASKFDAQLLLLHVLHDPAEAPGFYASKKAGKKVLKNMEQAAVEMLDEFVDAHLKKWKKVEARVVPGLPATVVVKVAEADQVDLVVVGTRGHTGVQRLLLGSVADKVIRACRCPVLSVHGDKKARAKGGRR
jgi:nucleotide-binding universal stress UspA family protein